MRFKNLKYSHTDTFHSDDYVAKFVADFDIEKLGKDSFVVDDDDFLVIEIDVQDGVIGRPFISNLEDNTDTDTTDEEMDFILKFYESIKNKAN